MKYLVCLLVCSVMMGCGTDKPIERADKVGKTVVGKAFARGRDADCMNNIRQVRYAIQIEKTSSEDGSNPPSLAGLKGISKNMIRCSVEPNETYEYDASTGLVRCVHKGHEKY